MITTPESWHWDISPEDVKKLNAVDRDTINRVYFANFKKFERIANKYCRFVIRNPSYIDDCVQQIYVDLPLYDYTDNGTLFACLMRSCRSAALRSRYEISLFTPVHGKDKDCELADFLGKDFFAELEDKQVGEENALIMINSQTALSAPERDFLTAVAFRVRPYEGLFYEEFTRHFGKNHTGKFTA